MKKEQTGSCSDSLPVCLESHQAEPGDDKNELEDAEALIDAKAGLTAE